MTAPVKPTPIQAPAVPKSTKGNRTVTVASKLPMSIILQLCRAQENRSTGRWGETIETIHIPTGEQHVIRGTSYPAGTPPKRFPKPPDMVEEAGFALTHGIPADFFEEWYEQNKMTELVRNGMIKAATTRDDVEDMAMDHAKVMSGLEPLQPDDDPRSPRPLNPQIEDIKPDVERSRQRAA